MKSVLCGLCIVLSNTLFAENASSNFEDEVYCGLGGNLGLQRTKVGVNKGFARGETAGRSGFYGCTFNVGYSQKICGNCFIGIEGGIDLGGGCSSKFGGVLEYESIYIQNEVKLRDALRQMLSEAGRSLNLQLGDPLLFPDVIDNGVWHNFAGVLRYLGCNNDTISAAFVNLPASGGGICDMHYVGNPNARLEDFIPHSWSLVNDIGNSNTLDGLEQIRNFIGRHYPAYATALANIATNDLTTLEGIPSPGTSITGGSNINGAITDIVSYFLLNDIEGGTDYSTLGINDAVMGGVTFDQLKAIMDSIYFPSAADNAAFTVPAGVYPRTVVNNVKTKATFGICPYLACKIGYYFNEVNGILYAKFGVILLNGRITPENTVYGLQDEKFYKIAPMIGCGLMKNINEKWGWAVEISHAFRTKKKMKDVHLFGMKVENSTSISRTNVRLMATYRF